MRKLISLLSKNISVQEASTGTIYLNYKGVSIRISNHEPNYAMKRQRGAADHEIYTHSVEGVEINSKYDVVEKVAEIYNTEIAGTLKGILTRRINAEVKNIKFISELKQREEDAYSEWLESDEGKAELANKEKARKIIQTKQHEILLILNEAEEYGNEGSNSKKQAKRARSYFKRKTKEVFGVEIEKSSVVCSGRSDYFVLNNGKWEIKKAP